MLRYLLTYVILFLTIFGMYGDDPLFRPDDKQWAESPQVRAISEAMMPSPAIMTGACEFTLPLYTVDVEGFKIPLSLKYHSNGVKVYDARGCFGYGWSLLPTLRITRTIMGRPDGRYENVASKGKEFAENSIKNAFGCVAHRYDVVPGRESYDTEYDIFNIYLLDATLTVIYKDGKFIGIENDEYRIETDADLDSIHVTDPLGNIYNFTEHGSSNFSSGTFCEWALGSVILQSGTEIKFDWISTRHTHKERIVPPRNISFNNLPHFLYDTYKFPEETKETEGEATENIKALSGISFPGGSVKLEYSSYTNRMTVSSDSRTVYSATMSTTSEGLLRYVEIAGTGKYEFNYLTPVELHETSCDWWGYPNGKMAVLNQRHYLSPHVKIKEMGDTVLDYGVDRSVNERVSASNLLAEVIYPSGGRTYWDYESHRFNSPEPPRIPEITLENEVTLTKGGGLRVKSISHGDRTVRYYYGENRSGLANIEAAPFLITFLDYNHLVMERTTMEHNSGYALYDDKRIIVQHQSSYLDEHPGLIPIWYDKVEEVSDEGKAEYRFRNFTGKNTVYMRMDADNNGRRGLLPYDGHYDLYTPFSNGPQMVSRTVYQTNAFGAYEKVEEDVYDYEVIKQKTDSVVPFFRVYRNHVLVDGFDAPDWDMRPGSRARHNFINGRHSISEEPFEYTLQSDNSCFLYPDDPFADDEESLKKQCAFWYAPKEYRLHLKTERLRRKINTKYFSGGTMTTTEEYNYLPGTSLLSNKIVSDGVNTTQTKYSYVDSLSAQIRGIMSKRNITGMTTSVLEYRNNTMKGYTLELAQSGTILYPQRVWQIRGTNKWAPSTYKYNNKGYLVEMTSPTGLKTVWERDKYGNPVKMSVGNDDLVNYATWDNLVGVTSLTSPSGIKETFGYDQYGRLASRSLNQTLMEEYEYQISGGHYILTKQHYSADGYTRQYARYDGLGRNHLNQQEQPDGSFISLLTDYDRMGRPEKNWLPVNTSENISQSDIRNAAREQYSDENPYQTLLYEHSLRGVLERTIRPGEAWLNGEIFSFPQQTVGSGTSFSQKITYNTNSSKNSVERYEVTADGVRQNGTYPPGTILIQTEKDEDGHTTVTCTDFRGLTVCLQNPAITRYVYNDHGELAYILPPGLSGNHARSDADMQRLAYWYDYDTRGRVVTKKLPGVREAYYIYDDADRLMAEQNADLADGQWRLYGYDRLNRSVLTLDCTITRSQAEEYAKSIRVATLNGGPLAGYTLTGLPVSKPEVVNATYYDNYNFTTLCNLPEEFNFKQPASHTKVTLPVSFGATGMITGVYTGKGYEAYYYNSQGNMSQRYATGFNRGRTSNSYTYTGQISATVHESEDDQNVGVTIVRYTYDTTGRPVTTNVTKSFPEMEYRPDIDTKSVEPRPPHEELARKEYSTTLTTEYNQLGQVATTTHGNGVTRQYSYNIQGWLSNTTTSTPVKTLTETLHYETGRYPCYNGNISAKEWTNGRYDYRYDTANRLTDAEFDYTRYKGDYTTSYSYDDRGNPLSVVRQGQIDPPSLNDVYCGELDNLSLRYTGNQLTSVFAMSNALEFEGQTGVGQNGTFKLEYDKAGRLTKDQTRNIRSISYNNNGNPLSMEFYDGSAIDETYDGMGNHLSTDYLEANSIHSTIHDREYTGTGHIYERGKIQIERTPGGYFDYATKSFRHYLTDYQGNNIAVADNDGFLLEQTDYYPYGEPWHEPDHPYTYSDNERLHTFGQNQYDFHARRLVTSLLRFDKPDPLMEQYPWLSPYIYCAANPMLYTDHNGLRFTKRAENVVSLYEDKVKRNKESAERDIAKQQEKMKSAKNEKQKNKIQKKIDKLNDIVREMGVITEELSVLRESDQLYDIERFIPSVNEYVTSDDSGKTTFENGTVLMTIPYGGRMELVAHELKHAYQFEVGEMSLGKGKGKDKGFYDYTDEVSAYKRGSYFGGSERVPSSYNELKNFDENVGKYIYINTDPNKLQQKSNELRAVFRWNNHTYIPENF